MKIVFTFLLFFSAVMFSAAQVVPWKYNSTSISHRIYIGDANITIDNVPFKSGDAIGVFYDSLGYIACGGYAIWPATQIIAYGNDSGGNPNGFSSAGLGEPFYLKLWDKQRNCVVDSGTIVQFQALQPLFPDSAYFQPNGSSKLTRVNGVNKKVSYAKTNYCATDADPLPVIVGTIPDLLFLSQPGLALNATTGQINIAASTPGTYTVYFNTSLCLVFNSMRITIKMTLENLNVNVAKSTCTEKGQLTLDAATIVCGTAPYQFRLHNLLNGQETINNTGLFADVDDAVYELYVKDANNEEQKWSRTIKVEKECKDLIIAPNGPSGQASTYFIPYEGKAKIYDRYGSLKKEMSIPGDWDATDNTGNLVAMGQYIIICNENQQIVVTVIK
jgi:hypothetical protein